MYILIETTTIAQEEELKKFLTENKISFKENFEEKIISEFKDFVNENLDIYNVCKHCDECVPTEKNEKHICFDKYSEEEFVNDFKEKNHKDYAHLYMRCVENFYQFIYKSFNI